MAWIKVPLENHPLFRAALPKDPRVETLPMFGGIAARVNGNMFAGLFGRSTIVFLAEADRATALALDGASLFDPMGDGKRKSDKVMLPEEMMDDAEALRDWVARAFEATAKLPRRAAKPAKKTVATKPATKAKQPATKSIAKPAKPAKPKSRAR